MKTRILSDFVKDLVRYFRVLPEAGGRIIEGPADHYLGSIARSRKADR